MVWLGLRDVEPLVALQQTLASALHQHGVAPSTRKVPPPLIDFLINCRGVIRALCNPLV